jgi:hypothetical protein
MFHTGLVCPQQRFVVNLPQQFPVDADICPQLPGPLFVL